MAATYWHDQIRMFITQPVNLRHDSACVENEALQEGIKIRYEARAPDVVVCFGVPNACVCSKLCLNTIKDQLDGLCIATKLAY